MNLNRFFRHALVPDRVLRNIVSARDHANELLKIVVELRKFKPKIMSDGRQLLPFAFTLPFAGRAMFLAVDVVSAGGSENCLGSTCKLIKEVLEPFRSLASYYASAHEPMKTCELRGYQIQNVITHPTTARSGCWLGREWGLADGLKSEFEREDDCIYGVPDRTFYDALGNAGRSPPSISLTVRDLTNGKSGRSRA